MTMWTTALWNHDLPTAQWAVVLAMTLVAAVIDLRTRRIPNVITFPAMAGGLLVAVLVAGWAGLADATAAGFILALPYLLLFLMAGGGAGDVKLMAALGMWLGLVSGVLALLCITMAGAVMASMMIALSKRRLTATAGMADCAARSITMPYGVAICIGTWLAAIGVLLWRA